MGILCTLLFLYWLLLLVRVFSSWFPIRGSGVIRSLLDGVYAITEPVLRPVRGLLPPLRMGAMGLDLSPIIVFIVIAILQGALCRG